MNNDRVVLIDSMNLVYRAQFRHGHLQTASGQKTGVIFSFLRMLKTVYEAFEHSPLLICWEGGVLEVAKDGKSFKVAKHEPTWRKALPRQDYKGNRKITPDVIEAHKQVPAVQEVLTYLRHHQLSVPRLEGDDLIGIAAGLLLNVAAVKEIAIVSSDKDFFQCINDKVSVYRPGKGTLKKVTAKKVFKEFGVWPNEWAAYKAFIGDSSDHYKGIKGVGPKAAVDLIRLGANPLFGWKEQPKAVRLQYTKLEKDWECAMDCYKLAKIPESPRHSLFDKELKQLAVQAFDNLERRLQRKFSASELKQAIHKFTYFCGKYEMYGVLADRRKFFNGVLCDGRFLIV